MTEAFDPQQLQERLVAVQQEIMSAELTGRSSGGEVTVTGDGVGNVAAVRIDPALDRDDLDGLQNHIVDALADLAQRRAGLVEQKMTGHSSGFAEPDFGFGGDGSVPRTPDGLIDLG